MRILSHHSQALTRINSTCYLCRLISNGFTDQALIVISQIPTKALHYTDQHFNLPPLHVAIKCCNVEICKQLLARGVNIHKIYNDLSAYDLAMISDSEQIRNLFTFS